jgi:hypothetical protein
MALACVEGEREREKKRKKKGRKNNNNKIGKSVKIFERTPFHTFQAEYVPAGSVKYN